MHKKNVTSKAYEAAKELLAKRAELKRAGVDIKQVEHGWMVRGVTYPLLKDALKAAREVS